MAQRRNQVALEAGTREACAASAVRAAKAGLWRTHFSLAARGLRSWAEDLLNDPGASEYLHADRARQLLREHLSGRLNRGVYLWDVLNFLSWQRQSAA